MQLKIGVLDVRILVNMINTLGIEERCASLDPVNEDLIANEVIALSEKID